MPNPPELPYNGAAIEVNSPLAAEQAATPSFDPEQFSPDGPVRDLLQRRTRINKAVDQPPQP